MNLSCSNLPACGLVLRPAFAKHSWAIRGQYLIPASPPCPRELVYLHLGMNTFRLWAPSNPAPDHMFGMRQSQDSNPEQILGLPVSFQALGPLPGIHIPAGSGLETALAPVPSPQAGQEDLEAIPLYTWTCCLAGKSGPLSSTRRRPHFNLPSHKDNTYPILPYALSGLSYNGLTQL